MLLLPMMPGKSLCFTTALYHRKHCSWNLVELIMKAIEKSDLLCYIFKDNICETNPSNVLKNDTDILRWHYFIARYF